MTCVVTFFCSILLSGSFYNHEIHERHERKIANRSRVLICRLDVIAISRSGGWRNVEVITGKGHWRQSGKGALEVLWVHVRDLSGTHREEYFYTTNLSMSAQAVIEMHGARWNIETTFQEMREHLGLETTRGWSRQTVLRMAPCLFRLSTVVVIFFDALPWSNQHLRRKSWLGKEQTTFSDMITSVRRYLWSEWIFEWAPGGEAVQKLSRPIKKLLDFGLAQAA